MDYGCGLGSIMAQPPSRLAGSALFVGVVQFGIALLLAEATYPGYSVSTNAISDLGATCKSGVCQIVQPSSTIFNSSIVLLGLLVLLTSYYLHKAFKMRPLTIFIAIAAHTGSHHPSSYGTLRKWNLPWTGGWRNGAADCLPRALMVTRIWRISYRKGMTNHQFV